MNWKLQYFDLLTKGLDKEANDILQHHMPTKIFKYYALSEYTLQNIERNRLWFSNPEFYNDPYDSLIQRYFPFGKFLIENDIMSLLMSHIEFDRDYLTTFAHDLFKDFHSIKDTVDKFLYYLFQLRDQILEKDRTSITFLIKKIEAMRIGIYDDRIKNRFFDSLYVTCFTEVPDNILMWSHYAQSNTGICIEYALDQFLKVVDNEKMKIAPVIYMDNIFSCKEYSNCNSPLPQIIVKKSDWCYEQEWRMSCSGKDCMKGVEKPSPTITKIILGSNFNYSEKHSLKDRLISIIGLNGIKLSRMKPENNAFRLNEYPIKL